MNVGGFAMSEITETVSKRYSARSLVTTGMMIALTIILAFTPIGMIRLPVVSITIAHVPAIIAAMVMTLPESMAVALAFGFSSLFLAISSPASILDPYFVNPLVSILPRALIPVTAYFTYHGLKKLMKNVRQGDSIAIIVGTVVGNLTNTFGVYAMLYLIYAQQIFEKTGKPALSLIIAAISTTTLYKCIGIVIIVLPIVKALKKAIRR
ncbi:MAG: ECF transporter S component [Ruminococcaceae bacterium]|nr:ECF transporter S component [Oscillospiraceae bacterium]